MFSFKRKLVFQKFLWS